jgi:hypothetical protein
MRAYKCTLLSTLILFSACAEDSLAPARPAHPPADLARHAFRLTIDVRSGVIEVAAPEANRAVPPSASTHPSFSLIGHDGVRVTARPCTFSPVPGNPRRKRCTLLLEIENLLNATDLVTPTEFPRPLGSVTGVLAFPLTATARGGTDPTVLPSPDWDMAPANFFNDFDTCSSGGKSDCYRYEAYGSPLYAGDSEVRVVGFDVPVTATSVTAYVAVAADLRDNPVRTFRLSADGGLSGSVTREGDVLSLESLIQSGTDVYFSSTPTVYRGYLSFDNVLPQVPLVIKSAELLVYPLENGYFTSVPDAEPLDYGATLDGEDFDLAGSGAARHMFLSSVDDRYRAGFGAEVQLALDTGADRFQFRLLASEFDAGFVQIDGTGHSHSPTLVVSFTLQ